MEKVILKSTTDFVLQFGKEKNRFGYEEAYDAISGYANFLIQPLTLGMFVPAKLIDGVWVVLEGTYSKQPDRNDYFNDLGGNLELYQHNMRLWREYQESKERCLFEGFELEYKNTVVNDDIQILFYKSKLIELVEIFDGQMPDSKGKISTIEDLVKYNLELTPTAQKQIGL